MRARTVGMFAVSFATLALAWSCSPGGSGGASSSVAPKIGSVPAATTSGSNTGTTPVTTSSNPVVSGNILVPYVLIDPGSAALSVDVTYSLNGGGSWQACTQAPGGDPRTGLTSSPAGVNHVFCWNTYADLGANLDLGVLVQIVPTGQGPEHSPPFDVDNRGLATPTANITIDRGPYLQATTRTSVKICWRTTTRTDSVVEYGAGLSFGSRAGNPAGQDTLHAVTISSLTAGTSYSYRILSGGAIATTAGTFTTAPDPSAPSFTALIFGDSGSGSQYQFNLAALMANENFDLALHLGDVIYPDGADKDYDPYFFAPYAAMIKNHPMFPAMGNHDLLTLNGAAYLSVFQIDANNPSNDKRYYSFEWGDAKFISLETSDLFLNQPQGSHMTWLQQELASNTRRWLVVMMHVPLYSSGIHGDNATLQAQLQPLFEQYKVDLVLQGHDHQYERMGPIKKYSTDPNWSGIPFIVSGGGGSQWYPIFGSHPTTLAAEATYHYTSLVFTHDAIRGKAIRSDNTPVEAFTINHK